jgi:uncharacterized protein (TIGR02145 family)
LLNDPCPSGWRLPTAQELENLRAAGYRWDSELTGAWLGPDASSATFLGSVSAVFFPAGGLILMDVLHNVGEGRAWTSTQSSNDGGQALIFTSSTSMNVTSHFHNKYVALPVRCVKE